MEYFITPQHIFIGDECQLYIKVDNINLDTQVLNAPLETKIENEHISINSFELTKINKEDFLIINFTPWQLGEVSFPDLKKHGINFLLPKFTVHSIREEIKTSSIVEDDTCLLIPGTTRLILFSIAISIIFIVTIIALVKKISIISPERKKIKNVKKHKAKIKRLFKNQKKSINELTLISEQEIRAILKECFTCFKSINITSLTYSEILTILEGEEKISKEIITILEKIFAMLKQTRFNNESLNKEEFYKNILDFFNCCLNEGGRA